MVTKNIYQTFNEALLLRKKLLAVLIDPEKFDNSKTAEFLRDLPANTTHLFVGGSTVAEGDTQTLVQTLKLYTSKPIVLFPGDVSQISEAADALLFLTLLSGRNPEYLIGQQVKAASLLHGSRLEIIPTGYVLIDGGNESAVARVTDTTPLPQGDIQHIVATARAGELMGARLIYLEAGSGAIAWVGEEIVSEVKKVISIPLIVGGGIRTEAERTKAYQAGADMVVMGTAFENE